MGHNDEEDINIKKYLTHNEEKSAVAENVIRTLTKFISIWLKYLKICMYLINKTIYVIAQSSWILFM